MNESCFTSCKNFFTLPNIDLGICPSFLSWFFCWNGKEIVDKWKIEKYHANLEGIRDIGFHWYEKTTALGPFLSYNFYHVGLYKSQPWDLTDTVATFPFSYSKLAAKEYSIRNKGPRPIGLASIPHEKRKKCNAKCTISFLIDILLRLCLLCQDRWINRMRKERKKHQD